MWRTRTLLGAAVALFGVAVALFRPHPISTVLESCSLFYVGFYLTVGFLAVHLICGRKPVKFVDPAGKAVFITGCDSGFGYNLAQRLDSMGFQVFAGCLAPDREGAQQLAQTSSERLSIVALDVTDDWQVQQALEVVKTNCELGALWAIVNNAGIATFTEIEWCSVDQFQRLLDVNVLGVVRVTKAFLPLLRQSHGRVINVASLAGRFTIPAFAAYSMSKKACIGFSDALRLEMKKFDVSVVTIEPGLYRTPIAHEENLINMNRKSWAETPSSVKEDYGEEYFDAFLQNMTHQMKRARPNVDEVVDLMVTAVCAEKPSHRYVPYWMSYLRSLLLGNCPAALSDRIFQRLSVKVPPNAKKRSSSSKSSTSGTPRSATPGTPNSSVFSETPPRDIPETMPSSQPQAQS